MPGVSRRAFLGVSAAPVFAASRRRPNILILLPDQLRAQSLGCYGDPNVISPCIDRLAASSLRFTSMIANTPVCCPARANLLTGRYTHRNGMVANDLRLRESEVTISSVLRDAGYRTGFIGKWHLDGGPRMPGFVPPGPRRHGFEFWAANECSHSHFNTQYFRDLPVPFPIERFETEAWGDLAVEFLRDQTGSRRPFFLTVASGPPHDPYKAPPEFSRLYDPARLELPATYNAGEVPREHLAHYYGMVTAVDAQVGRLLAELDTLRMSNDTIVLFLSDHGDMLGDHGERLKRKPWEESIRVPGLLRYPRLGARTVDTLFSHVDVAPTLLGLCGVPVPSTMQGTNLAPHLTGAADAAAPPEETLLQIFGPYRGDATAAGWRGLRTTRFTYARYQDRPWVLYDNLRDPLQQHNRIGDHALVARLDRRLEAAMHRTGDSWSYNWTAPVEDGGRLYNDRAWYTVEDYLNSPAARVVELSAAVPRRSVIFYGVDGVPGHAFAAIEREDAMERRTRVDAWGFYPDPNVSTARAAATTVRGVVLDEVLGTKALPRATETLVVHVAERQARAVEALLRRWRCDGASYRLLEADCVTLVDEVARLLQLQTPERGGGAHRPAEYVRRLIALN